MKYRFKISLTRRDMNLSLFTSIADMPIRNCKEKRKSVNYSKLHINPSPQLSI